MHEKRNSSILKKSMSASNLLNSIHNLSKSKSEYSEVDTHNLHPHHHQQLDITTIGQRRRSLTQSQNDSFKCCDEMDNGKSSCSHLAKVDSKTLAQQITLIDCDLFANIEREELLSFKWTGPDKQKKAPNIVEMTNWFNQLNYWVRDKILQVKNVKQRAKILSQFIEVIKNLIILNNFHSGKSICTALQSQCIYRLKITFSYLTKSQSRDFDEIQELLSEENNFYKLRSHIEHLENNSHVYIPYLAVYLKDLTYIHDFHRLSNKTNQEMRKHFTENTLKEIMNKINKSQQRCIQYEFPRKLDIIYHLRNYRIENSSLKDDEQYNISKRLEDQTIKRREKKSFFEKWFRKEEYRMCSTTIEQDSTDSNSIFSYYHPHHHPSTMPNPLDEAMSCIRSNLPGLSFIYHKSSESFQYNRYNISIQLLAHGCIRRKLIWSSNYSHFSFSPSRPCWLFLIVAENMKFVVFFKSPLFFARNLIQFDLTKCDAENIANISIYNNLNDLKTMIRNHNNSIGRCNPCLYLGLSPRRRHANHYIDPNNKERINNNNNNNCRPCYIFFHQENKAYELHTVGQPIQTEDLNRNDPTTTTPTPITTTTPTTPTWFDILSAEEF